MKKYDNEISLAKFLTRYLQFTGKDLKKLTHEKAKEIFPLLDMEDVDDLYDAIEDDPSLVYLGKVVYVNDGRTTIPYRIPTLIQDNDEYTEFSLEEVEKNYYKKESYDFVTMSNYELKTLLNSKFNSRRNKLSARKELEDRGVVISKSLKRKREEYKENLYGKY